MNENLKNLIFEACKNLNAELVYENKENFGYVFLVPCDEGRKQNVIITRSEDYLKIATPIARYQYVNPVAVLEYNFLIQEGSLGVADFDFNDGLGNTSSLFFVTTQLIKTADLEEIQNKIKTTAIEGDRVEKTLIGRDRI
ncbi:MAG TPA: hypothetical protein PLW61_01255 [Caldisericia bacterium]|nr:hypothetical protein [Caldisericia bacterium]HPB33383.1 hypothetical protein [Caldisericia bacterium]HQL66831.1 hypothetical protein [Caldisericia bacterium]HQN48036.1 hypothetical protein [Caldisericia bacterium]HQO99140.1 hypothetical protein [Caldisericia bacterium]